MKRNVIYILGGLFGIFAVILNSKITASAALEGINICITTVIPSLFPLMVLSIYITGQLRNSSLKFLGPVSRICRINEGLESLLLVGFIGGYPVGAQCIANEHAAGRLTKKDAQRMLGFCSNAGPSFIFGIAGGLFQSWIIPWILWIIHIVSSILTGIILPGGMTEQINKTKSEPTGISDAVQTALRSIAFVCAWVVIFRIIYKILTTWFLQYLPIEIQILINGTMELVNGFCALAIIENISLKFILCSAFLSFGGICVCMQTMSVIKDLDIKCYLKGKIIQTIFSLILSYIVSSVLFADNNTLLFIIIITITVLMLIISKIGVDFHRKMVYNTKKSPRG